MHCPTHLMSGWCVANLFPLNGRERLAAMLAAAIADVDALTVIGGWEAYQTYHHRLAHNLPFGLLACGILWCFTGWKLWPFVLYLALFHLHLVMDFFGSGPGWGIYYFWPFSQWAADNWHYSWEFSSWQNTTTAGVLLMWAIAIAYFRRRTPLEVVMPNLDRQLVELLYRVLGRTQRLYSLPRYSGGGLGRGFGADAFDQQNSALGRNPLPNPPPEYRGRE